MNFLKQTKLKVLHFISGISHQYSNRASSMLPKSGHQSQLIFDRALKYGAHNYHPLPVALSKGKGVTHAGNLNLYSIHII